MDQDRLIREAIGEFTPLERRVFAGNLLSTLVHDVNVLRGLSGDPAEVLFTDVWAGGESMLTSCATPRGSAPPSRSTTCRTWPTTRRRWPTTRRPSRIKLTFPSPFFRNMPTGIVVESMEEGKAAEKRVTASMEEAFKEELLHFAECVGTGARPITTPEDAKGDVALLHRIFHAIKRPLVGMTLSPETRAGDRVRRARPGGSSTVVRPGGPGPAEGAARSRDARGRSV